MLHDPEVQDKDPVLRRDWHVVARSDDLPEGGVLGARLLGLDLVLWRVDGQVAVAKNLCRHRGGSFYDLRGAGRFTAKIIDGCLQCPYHGWEYDHSGQCVRFPHDPERKPGEIFQLYGYRAAEQYDWIWVCLDETEQDVPEFFEWPDDSFRKIFSGPYPLRAAAPRFIENFLDVPHFIVVHQGLLGDPEHPEVPDYEVTAGPDGVIAHDIQVWQPDPDGTGQGKTVSYTYQVLRPLTVRLYKKSGDNHFGMFCHVTPSDETESVVWVYMAMNYAFDEPAEKIREFQDVVTGQDVPIVENQRPELLPLDLSLELHLRADKASIAYRKWLKELGLTFGTA